jgi:hypothetical protein
MAENFRWGLDNPHPLSRERHRGHSSDLRFANGDSIDSR